MAPVQPAAPDDDNHRRTSRSTGLHGDVQSSGGFDTLADTGLETAITDERAGLLSHSRPNDPEAYSEATENGNKKHQAAWLTDNDFSSLPWWKRPSVRALFICFLPPSLGIWWHI